MTSNKFKPFIARTNCCDSLILLTRERQYTSCPCGKTSVDAGDGYYHRINCHEDTGLPVFYRFHRMARKHKNIMVCKKKLTKGPKQA